MDSHFAPRLLACVLALVTTASVALADQPVVIDPISDISVSEGQWAQLAVSATDPDNDLITLTASLPAFGVLNPPTSGMGFVYTLISFTPGFDDAGTYAGLVVASTESANDSVLFAIHVFHVDLPPTLSAISDVLACEGETRVVPVSASDPDNDLITLSASLPAFGVLNPPVTGLGTVATSMSFTPGFDDQGVYLGVVTATATGLSVSYQFVITVCDREGDHRPIVDAPPSVSGTESAEIAFIVTAVDPDGDAIQSLTAAPLPAGASFGTDPTNASGTFAWTPNVGQAGNYSVTFVASNALTGVASTTIEVSPRPNLPPTCSFSGPPTALVCTPVLFDASGSSDPDGTIANYRWDFGDGEQAEGGGLRTVTHVYQTNIRPGSYFVALWVRDDTGDSSAFVSEVLVESPEVPVTGRILRLNGKPIDGAVVRAYLPQAEGPPQAVAEAAPSAPDGSFRLSLRPGTGYALRCDQASFWDETATGITVCPSGPPPVVNFAMVKRDEMSGVIRVRYDGFTSGTLPSTHLAVDVRAPSAGMFQVRYEDEEGTWLDPGSGITAPRRAAKGEIWTEEFLIALKQPGPAPSPISVKVDLLRQGLLGTTSVDTDILRMVVDAPLTTDLASGLDDPTAQVLLRQFQPVFLMHSTEPWTPKAVDIMLDRATMAFADSPIGDMKGGVGRGLIAGWQTLNSVGPPTFPYLDLYGDGQAKADSKKAGEEYLAFERNYPEVVYGTAVESNGRMYLSYWCFYYFEAWSLATHEGDWEGITILLRKDASGWAPESAFFSHHPTLDNPTTLESLAWEDVEMMPVNGRRVPIVYVAEQAHGSYPHRRLKPSVPAPGEDYYDGAGPRIFPFDSPRCGTPCADRYARLDYLPRLNKIAGSHPASWALFGGSYGFAVTPPPLGPPMTANPWRWTSPGMWIADALNSSRQDSRSTLPRLSALEPEPPLWASVALHTQSSGTEFEIKTGTGARVDVQIFDVTGRLVRTVTTPTGSQTRRILWDRRNSGGLRVASGIYFFRTEIVAAGIRAIGPRGKVVVLR